MYRPPGANRPSTAKGQQCPYRPTPAIRAVPEARGRWSARTAAHRLTDIKHLPFAIDHRVQRAR
jgi:hypothetical protein